MPYSGPAKLVRDRIPEIIEDNNEVPITHTVEGDELLQALFTKLEEEVAEVVSAETSQDRLEELADVLELVRAIANFTGADIDKVLDIMEEKTKKRGGFDLGIILERTES